MTSKTPPPTDLQTVADAAVAATDAAYEKALDYLYEFINFEHKRIERYQANKLDPGRPRRLLRLLGDPHLRFPAIHIAGTKGKGSVAALCAAALRAAGLRVGLYTSPHVQEFRERIRILTPDDADGRIPPGDFVHQMDQVRAIADQAPGLTWFEIVTGIAFAHFAAQEVDVAVVEVGLGGRLDATNVLTPLVSVITSLSLDHTHFLGDTLAEIAREKGGIIKPGVPLVTAHQPPEALAPLRQIAAEREAPLTTVGEDYTYRALSHGPHGQEIVVTRAGSGESWQLQIPLAGAHQQHNAAVALAALHIVEDHFPGLTADTIAKGMSEVAWPGRLQIVHQAPDTPTVLADCAHNEESAAVLAHALTEDYHYHRLWLIFGVSADKDVAEMMGHLFPLADRAIVTISSHRRAAAPEWLAETAAGLGFAVETADTVAAALTAAWQAGKPNDLICVTGSIFMVGDLLNQWEALQSQWRLSQDERPDMEEHNRDE